MFSIILSSVAMEEGLSISYTVCLNANKLFKKYDWLTCEFAIVPHNLNLLKVFQ